MSAISAGDLVVVVKLAPCGCGATIPVFVVQQVRRSRPAFSCASCASPRPSAIVAVRPDGLVVELSRLIKIDPKPETITRDEEATA